LTPTGLNSQPITTWLTCCSGEVITLIQGVGWNSGGNAIAMSRAEQHHSGNYLFILGSTLTRELLQPSRLSSATRQDSEPVWLFYATDMSCKEMGATGNYEEQPHAKANEA